MEGPKTLTGGAGSLIGFLSLQSWAALKLSSLSSFWSDQEETKKNGLYPVPFLLICILVGLIPCLSVGILFHFVVSNFCRQYLFEVGWRLDFISSACLRGLLHAFSTRRLDSLKALSYFTFLTEMLWVYKTQ